MLLRPRCTAAPHHVQPHTLAPLTDAFFTLSSRSEPVDKESFLRNLWWCFDTLAEKAEDDSGKPAYFRFLTLLGVRRCASWLG